MILKPAVGCGRSGVRLCRTGDEVAEHTRHLLGGTHIWRSSPQVLVEGFVQGSHYTAQIMGKEAIGTTTSDFGPPPHFVYRQFTFQAALPAEEHGRIEKVAR